MQRETLAGIAGALLLFLLWRGGKMVSDSIERQDSLELLEPSFRKKVQKLIQVLQAQGYEPWVYETLRTAARQDWLYASGRTRPGPIVTDVDSSAPMVGHGVGLAADIIDGRPHPTRSGQKVGWGSWTGDPGDAEAKLMADAFFDALGSEAKKLGLVWGGDWILSGGGSDRPHVQAA